MRFLTSGLFIKQHPPFLLEVLYDNLKKIRIFAEIFDFEIVFAVYDTPGSQLKGANQVIFNIMYVVLFIVK